MPQEELCEYSGSSLSTPNLNLVYSKFIVACGSNLDVGEMS